MQQAKLSHVGSPFTQTFDLGSQTMERSPKSKMHLQAFPIDDELDFFNHEWEERSFPDSLNLEENNDFLGTKPFLANSNVGQTEKILGLNFNTLDPQPHFTFLGKSQVQSENEQKLQGLADLDAYLEEFDILPSIEQSQHQLQSKVPAHNQQQLTSDQLKAPINQAILLTLPQVKDSDQSSLKSKTDQKSELQLDKSIGGSVSVDKERYSRAKSMYEAESKPKTNILKIFDRLVVQNHYEKINEDSYRKYTQALKLIDTKNESLHGKIYDKKSGKFIEKRQSGVEDLKKIIDQTLILKRGSILAKMDAEIDLMIHYENNKKKKPTKSQCSNTLIALESLNKKPSEYIKPGQFSCQSEKQYSPFKMFPRKGPLQSVSSCNNQSLKEGTCDLDQEIEITTENEFQKYVAYPIQQKPVKKKLLTNLTGYIYPNMDQYESQYIQDSQKSSQQAHIPTVINLEEENEKIEEKVTTKRSLPAYNGMQEDDDLFGQLQKRKREDKQIKKLEETKVQADEMIQQILEVSTQPILNIPSTLIQIKLAANSVADGQNSKKSSFTPSKSEHSISSAYDNIEYQAFSPKKRLRKSGTKNQEKIQKLSNTVCQNSSKGIYNTRLRSSVQKYNNEFTRNDKDYQESQEPLKLNSDQQQNYYPEDCPNSEIDIQIDLSEDENEHQLEANQFLNQADSIQHELQVIQNSVDCAKADIMEIDNQLLQTQELQLQEEIPLIINQEDDENLDQIMVIEELIKNENPNLLITTGDLNKNEVCEDIIDLVSESSAQSTEEKNRKVNKKVSSQSNEVRSKGQIMEFGSPKMIQDHQLQQDYNEAEIKVTNPLTVQISLQSSPQKIKKAKLLDDPEDDIFIIDNAPQQTTQELLQNPEVSSNDRTKIIIFSPYKQRNALTTLNEEQMIRLCKLEKYIEDKYNSIVDNNPLIKFKLNLRKRDLKFLLKCFILGNDSIVFIILENNPNITSNNEGVEKVLLDRNWRFEIYAIFDFNQNFVTVVISIIQSMQTLVDNYQEDNNFDISRSAQVESSHNRTKQPLISEPTKAKPSLLDDCSNSLTLLESRTRSKAPLVVDQMIDISSDSDSSSNFKSD